VDRGLSSDFIPEGCLVLSFLVCLVIYEKLFGPSKQKVVQPESLRKEVDQFRPNKFVMNTGCASSLTSLGPLNLKLWGRTRSTWLLVVASNCGVTNAAPLQPHLHIPKLRNRQLVPRQSVYYIHITATTIRLPPSLSPIMPRRPREFGSVYGAPELTRSAGSSASAATAGVPQSDPYTLVVPVVPDGDTILEVSGGRGYSKRYLIYSSVLCSTSSVFRVMLGKHSKFAEAVALRESRKRDDDEPIVVPLEGDDPAMMGFILQALHGKNKKVPRKITIGQLTRIAVICDKYGLHEALQVIAGTWSENLKAKVKTHPEEWLLISWVFGPEEIFTEVSRDMILNGTAYQADGLVFSEERRALAECIPSAVTGT